MIHSDPPPKRSNEEPRTDNLGKVKGFLLVEGFALLVALVTPVTPSKTGSTWSPANYFSTDPSYLSKVASSFLMVNALLFAIGLVVWITSRFSGSD